MSYYKLLGLNSEPFSTSPDPCFLYPSNAHKAALCRLQISISLRRGLCVLLGDVGTGKTTLSRKLARELKGDPSVDFHMILNPYFKTDLQFLSRLAGLFHLPVAAGAGEPDLMEAVERYLFRRGVEENKAVVLLIDEAQILPEFVFETLRILLNYETNEYKILQLVLVGQMELLPRIRRMNNFWDRIALRYVLSPLDEEEVTRLIDFRLTQAGYAGGSAMFTPEAVRVICGHTRGYPRKLSLICHNCLEYLVMHGRAIVDAEVAQAVVAREMQAGWEFAEWDGTDPDLLDAASTVGDDAELVRA